LLAFVLACGCERQSSLPAAPADHPVATTQHIARAADRLDVLEAVFRHQFDENASAAQRNVDYFFLSLDNRVDPPAELLARFANDMPKVLPVSFAKASAMEGVAHEALGGRGLIFRIETIAWLDEDTAEVEGGYYEEDCRRRGTHTA
jgi:hypothetical protein